MTVTLEGYQYPLDVAISVINEVANTGAGRLEIPDIPDALGLAVDVTHILYKLNPFNNTELHLPHRDDPIQVPGKTKEGVDSYKLEIALTGSKFGLDIPSGKELCLISSDENSFGKVSVSANAINSVMNDKKGTPVEMVMRRKGLLLPERYYSMRLEVSYSTLKPYYISLPFCDVPPIRYIPGGDFGFLNYPVSEKDEHILNDKAYRFICEPVFWISWGQYSAQAISIISGEKTAEEIAEMFDQPLDKIIEHTEKARESIYMFMETRANGDDFGGILDRVHCPPEHAGKYVNDIIRGLSYFANPDTIDSEYVANLVRAYNEEYVPIHGVNPMTVDQLCNPPRRLGPRNDR